MAHARPPLAARLAERCKQWTAGLRMLPDFLIIGAMKAATTTLYELLIQHPQVIEPFTKELQFFTTHYREGIRWYQRRFPLAVQARLQSLRTGKRTITGEGSPYYLFHPHAARRIAAVLPKVKLIALLRNPIDRAYSDYHHKVLMNIEPLSFEDAIAREPERLHGELERMRANEWYESQNHQRFAYLARGLYLEQIAAYHQHFPREQLLILSAEEFQKNTATVFGRVLKFLGLDPWEPPNLNVRYNKQGYSRMPVHVREQLAAHFEPHNRRLYDYLGTDFGWEAVPASVKTASAAA